MSNCQPHSWASDAPCNFPSVSLFCMFYSTTVWRLDIYIFVLLLLCVCHVYCTYSVRLYVSLLSLACIYFIQFDHCLSGPLSLINPLLLLILLLFEVNFDTVLSLACIHFIQFDHCLSGPLSLINSLLLLMLLLFEVNFDSVSVYLGGGLRKYWRQSLCPWRSIAETVFVCIFVLSPQLL